VNHFTNSKRKIKLFFRCKASLNFAKRKALLFSNKIYQKLEFLWPLKTKGRAYALPFY